LLILDCGWADLPVHCQRLRRKGRCAARAVKMKNGFLQSWLPTRLKIFFETRKKQLLVFIFNPLHLR